MEGGPRTPSIFLECEGASYQLPNDHESAEPRTNNPLNELIIMFPTVLSCNNKENIKSLSTLSQPKPTKEFLQ